MRFSRSLTMSMLSYALLVAGLAIAQPPQPAAPAATPATPLTEADVKLLDAGKEPRAELRYRPQLGQKQEMTIIIRTSTEQEIFGSKMPSPKMPASIMVIETEVLGSPAPAPPPGGPAAAAAGDVAYRFTVKRADAVEEQGVQPNALEAMRKSLTPIVGLTGTGVITARGLPRDVKVDLPPNASPQMRQAVTAMQTAMGQSGTMLPAEAVGLGAKWQIVTALNQEGIDITQTAVYEFVAREADQIKLNLHMTQTAPRQFLKAPGMNARNPIELVELTGDGSGELTVNPTRLLPQKAAMTMKSTSRMEADMSGQKQPIIITVNIQTNIESKPL